MNIFAKETKHESDLETTPERAWELIGDFTTYPDWNPLAPKLKGKAKAGKRAVGLLNLGPRWLNVPFFPKIVTADANRELRWRGGLPALFMADHRMIIDNKKGQTRMVHRERFTGLLVLLARPTLGLISRRIYRRFDKALNTAATAEPVALVEAGEEE